MQSLKGLNQTQIRHVYAERGEVYHPDHYWFIGPHDREPHDYPRAPAVMPNEDTRELWRALREGAALLERERARCRA